MQIKKLLFAALTLLFVAGTASAQSQPSQLPFFFPKGFHQTSDPILQREEYVRWLNSTWACNQGTPNTGFNMTIPGADSIRIKTDTVSTDSVTENPAKMTMIFDHYIKQADGSIRYTDLCHTEVITPEQFKVVSDGLQKIAVDAAQRDYDFYVKIYDLSIEARAQKLGISKADLIKQLDEKVPGYNVTWREVHRIPKQMHPSDFVPRELHLGLNPPLGGILGVTWLNTGVIYYNPDAWITDALNGIPKVMQHEEVHGNINIQKWPLSQAFDVELIASIPEMLYPENQTDFPSHGYAKDIRELAQIYYGMDWAEMQKQIIKFDFAGNTVYDDAKFVYYYKQIDQIKAEMMKFFMDVTIPEFESDPVWWSAVNDIRGDSNTVFRVTMADHYQICSLGGCAASSEWLETHKEEILATAQRAFNAGVGKDRSSGNFNVTPWMLEQYNKLFTPAEQANIEKYFRQHPEQLRNLRTMTPAEAVVFMQRFKVNTLDKVTVQ